MNIGEIIKKLRKKKGITQTEMCRRLELTQPYLSLVEKGHNRPSMQLLDKFSKEFGIPVQIILWMTITEKDIPKETINDFRILKPRIDSMIEDIWGLDEINE